MAFVDLNTKEIVGAKKGSYIYYHEIGHLKFNETLFGKNFGFWKEQIFLWIILSIVVYILFPSDILKLLPFSIYLLFALMYFFEEAWAWGYALKVKRRKKK